MNKFSKLSYFLFFMLSVFIFTSYGCLCINDYIKINNNDKPIVTFILSISVFGVFITIISLIYVLITYGDKHD